MKRDHSSRLSDATLSSPSPSSSSSPPRFADPPRGIVPHARRRAATARLPSPLDDDYDFTRRWPALIAQYDAWLADARARVRASGADGGGIDGGGAAGAVAQRPFRDAFVAAVGAACGDAANRVLGTRSPLGADEALPRTVVVGNCKQLRALLCDGATADNPTTRCVHAVLDALVRHAPALAPIGHAVAGRDFNDGPCVKRSHCADTDSYPVGCLPTSDSALARLADVFALGCEAYERECADVAFVSYVTFCTAACNTLIADAAGRRAAAQGRVVLDTSQRRLVSHSPHPVAAAVLRSRTMFASLGTALARHGYVQRTGLRTAAALRRAVATANSDAWLDAHRAHLDAAVTAAWRAWRG